MNYMHTDDENIYWVIDVLKRRFYVGYQRCGRIYRLQDIRSARLF